MSKYISFDHFSDSDYEQFINDIPKYLLLKPIRSITNYKNNPRVKSFRDESIDEQFIRNLYLKEYRNEKKILQTHLLTIIDKLFIKKELNDQEYECLKNGNFTSEEFDKVALKLLETSKIKVKYIIKLLNIDDSLFYRFHSEEKNRKIEAENYKLKNRIKEINEKNKELQAEIKSYIDKIGMYKELEAKYKILEEENIKFKNHISSQESIVSRDNKSVRNIEVKDIINSIEKNMSHETYSLLLNTYKNMQLSHMDTKEILNKLYDMKNSLVEEEKMTEIKNIVFIEYILVSVKEIMKNGK
jgi:hypothetical protein